MDPYAVLGVTRGASADELKAAYRAALKRHHPDAGGDPARFREVNQAWEEIHNPRPEPPPTDPGSTWHAPPPPRRTTPVAPSKGFPIKRMIAISVVACAFVLWIGSQSTAPKAPPDDLKTSAQAAARNLFIGKDVQVLSASVSNERIDGISGTAYVSVYVKRKDPTTGGDLYSTEEVALGFRLVEDEWVLESTLPR